MMSRRRGITPMSTELTFLMADLLAPGRHASKFAIIENFRKRVPN